MVHASQCLSAKRRAPNGAHLPCPNGARLPKPFPWAERVYSDVSQRSVRPRALRGRRTPSGLSADGGSRSAGQPATLSTRWDGSGS